MVAAPSAQAAFPGANGKIAFEAGQDLKVVNPDGTGETSIYTTVGFGGWQDDLTWSPDGHKLAFMDGYLATINADGSGRQNLYAPDDLEGVTWSPDGARIALGEQSCSSEPVICDELIFDIGLDGTGGRFQIHKASDPSWSPDGTKIIFKRTPPPNCCYTLGQDAPLWTTNPSGGAQAPVGSLVGSGADWSPDGTKIAYSRYENNPPATSHIYVANADGSGETQLTNPGSGVLDLTPAWSPDGQMIAFARSHPCSPGCGNFHIYTMRADGSAQTDVTPGDTGVDTDPSWQPIPINSYPRPKGATPFKTFLVPAFKQCAAPGNLAHGAPLSFPSCSSPQQTSSYLTVGTPDSNGLAPTSRGSVQYTTVVGSSTSAADLKIAVNITGVLDKTALTPYSGEVEADVSVRITDKNSTPSPGAATMVDIPYPVTVPCAGGLCAVSTTANAVTPGAITAGQRAIWQLGQVQVYDGGADGLVSTTDNTLFMDEGIFIP
jgi:hypothetical protein